MRFAPLLDFATVALCEAGGVDVWETGDESVEGCRCVAAVAGDGRSVLAGGLFTVDGSGG